MRILKRLLVTCLLLVAAFAPAWAQAGGEKLLPEKVGDFQAGGRAPAPVLSQINPEDFGVAARAARNYANAAGDEFSVDVIKTRSAGAAYSLLRHFANHPGSGGLAQGLTPGRLGTVEGVGLGLGEAARVRFIKGDTFVDIRGASEQARRPEVAGAFAKLFADTLAGDPGELPVLVLHLPEWEKKQGEDLGFAVTLPALQQAAGNRPALDALSFEGGAEAVTATYGKARLVVVEFSTPQHSVDADAAVNERIAQLRAAGQPAPTLYRREGNYSVFVFDAPDEAAAGQLASGVKYEKDVRWLGRNPHADEIIARRYTQKMGGVILMTLITSGLAILLCLGIGGVIGGVIFLRRRARTAEQEVYTDAGGMVRLNLEDLNTPAGSVNLLGHRKE